MNTFLKKFMSLFFEKAEQPRIKPFMYAQLTLSIIAIILASLLVIDKIDNYEIVHFMIGTSFLLNGIENFIINKEKRRVYLTYFFSSLCFYWIAIDYILH